MNQNVLGCLQECFRQLAALLWVSPTTVKLLLVTDYELFVGFMVGRNTVLTAFLG